MRLVFLAGLLCLPPAFADEKGDREDIEKTIAAMEDSPFSARWYARGFQFDEVEQLGFGWLSALGAQEPAPVAISKEPWGEATIVGPRIRTVDGKPKAVANRLEGKFRVESIRFVTKDIALIDASYSRGQGPDAVLLIMHWQDGEWQFVSIRKLIP